MHARRKTDILSVSADRLPACRSTSAGKMPASQGRLEACPLRQAIYTPYPSAVSTLANRRFNSATVSGFSFSL